jgi:chromosome segregation ATPase
MNDLPGPHREKFKFTGAFSAILSVCLAIAVFVLGIFYFTNVNGLNAQLGDNQKQLAQAKNESSKVQADLDKAKAGATELQSQLDAAKAQLKSQADLAKLAASEQQAQQDKTKSASSELLKQIEADKVHLGELQTQLDEATAGATKLQAQLAQTKVQSVDLQARLTKAESDKAEAQALAQQAKQMPVKTALENAKGGRSYTLHLNNLQPDLLSVDVAITGANKPRSQHIVIAGGGTQNVEKLAAGENITITSQGYDPVKLTAQ